MINMKKSTEAILQNVERVASLVLTHSIEIWEYYLLGIHTLFKVIHKQNCNEM